MKKVDLTGEKFGRLTVLRRNGTKVYDNGHKQALWECKCECGNIVNVTLQHLRSGGVKSCGCLNRDIAKHRGELSKIGDRVRKHGDFGKPLYGVWAGMKRRCNNKNTLHYDDYGERGIRVCDEWSEYINFKNWAMENGYSEGLTIDIIDVNGNYEPANCRWVTMLEQQNNRRNTIYIEYGGKNYTIREISEITGLSIRTIRGRYERGWDAEQIFSPKLFNNQFNKG